MALGSIVISLLMQTASFESDTNRAAKLAERRAKEIDAAFRKAGTAIGVALGAAVAGVGYAIKNTIDSMDDMSKAAARSGMGAPEFSKLAHAAALADVSMQDLQSASLRLARAQSEATRGTGKQAEVFKRLGIEITDSTGTLRSAGDVLADFADRVAAAGDTEAPQMLADGMTIFGRSFQNLIPMLAGGSAGLREAAEEAERLGLVLSDQAGADAELFNDNISRMGATLKGLTMQLANELIPGMISAQQRLLDWIEDMGGVPVIFDRVRNAAEKVLKVITALSIYMGVHYVAAVAASTMATLAKAAALAKVSLATAAWSITLGAARAALATLFGPVGLLALGAVALYELATATTDAEDAAKKHADVMAQINNLAPSSIEAALGLAAAKREEAAATLEAARAALVEKQAKFQQDFAYAQDTARYGSGTRGDLAGMRAGASASDVQNAQALVAEIERQVSEIDKTITGLRVQKGVEDAFEFIRRPVFSPTVHETKAPKAKAEKEQVDELTKAYEAQLESLQKRAFLLANTGDDAALQYEIELGALRGLDEARVKELVALDATVSARERLAEQMREGQALTEQMATDTERAAAEIERASKLLEKGAISMETFNRVTAANASPAQRLLSDLRAEAALLGLTNDQREVALALRAAGTSATAGEREEIIRTIEAMQQFDKVAAVVDEAGAAFADMFGAIADGTKSGREAMRDFLADITRMIVQFLVQKAVEKFVQWIVGFWSPGASTGASTASTGGGTVGPRMASGGVFGNGLQLFANGGIVNSPTLFNSRSGPGLMGEAGPEAIMPVARGRDGKLGVAITGGSGAVSVNVSSQVNVDNSGGKGSDADAAKFGEVIKREVEATTMNVITREQRQGGALWKMRYG